MTQEEVKGDSTVATTTLTHIDPHTGELTGWTVTIGLTQHGSKNGAEVAK